MFSDATFAINEDLSSKLGRIVMLCDDTGSILRLQFKSYNAKKAVRSAMAAELIAFRDMFDVAYTIVEEIKHLLDNDDIPLLLYTDNKPMFEVIRKGSTGCA